MPHMEGQGLGRVIATCSFVWAEGIRRRQQFARMDLFMANGSRMSPSAGNVLSIVMGGGQGTRLFPLTRDRAKPAVPLAGKYRLGGNPVSQRIQSGLRGGYFVTPVHSLAVSPDTFPVPQ